MMADQVSPSRKPLPGILAAAPGWRRSKALDLGAPIRHLASGPGFWDFEHTPAVVFEVRVSGTDLSVGCRRNKKTTSRSFSLVEVSTP
jgi:hypothetical protein